MAEKENKVTEKVQRKSLQTFYSKKLLSRRDRGMFSIPWLAATYLSKLNSRHFKTCDVPVICNEIMKTLLEREPQTGTHRKPPKISLYLSSQLLYGLCVIHQKQVMILLNECSTFFMYMHRPIQTEDSKKKSGKQLKHLGDEIPRDCIPDKILKIDDGLTMDNFEFLQKIPPSGPITMREDTSSSFIIIDNVNETLPGRGSLSFLDCFIPKGDSSNITKHTAGPGNLLEETHTLDQHMQENIDFQKEINEQVLKHFSIIGGSDDERVRAHKKASVSKDITMNEVNRPSTSRLGKCSVANILAEHVQEFEISTEKKEKASVSIPISDDLTLNKTVAEIHGNRTKASVPIPADIHEENALKPVIAHKASIATLTEVEPTTDIETHLMNADGLEKTRVAICPIILTEQSELKTIENILQEPAEIEMDVSKATHPEVKTPQPETLVDNVLDNVAEDKQNQNVQSDKHTDNMPCEIQPRTVKKLPTSSEIILDPVNTRPIKKLRSRKQWDRIIEIPSHVFHEQMKNYKDTMRQEILFDQLRLNIKTDFGANNFFTQPGFLSIKSLALKDIFHRHLNSSKESTYDLTKPLSSVRDEEEEFAREHVSSQSLQMSAISSAGTTPASEKPRKESLFGTRPVKDTTVGAKQLEQLLELPEEQINDALPESHAVPLPQDIIEEKQPESLANQEEASTQKANVEQELEPVYGKRPKISMEKEAQSAESDLIKPVPTTHTSDILPSEIQPGHDQIQLAHVNEHMLQRSNIETIEELPVEEVFKILPPAQSEYILPEIQRESRLWNRTKVMKKLIPLWSEKEGLITFASLCPTQSNSKMDASQIFNILLQLHARRVLLLYQEKHYSDIFIKQLHKSVTGSVV